MVKRLSEKTFFIEPSLQEFLTHLFQYKPELYTVHFVFHFVKLKNLCRSFVMFNHFHTKNKTTFKLVEIFGAFCEHWCDAHLNALKTLNHRFE